MEGIWEDRGTYSLFANCRAVCADDQLLGCGGELCETTDGEVFVVEGGIVVDGVIGLQMLMLDKCELWGDRIIEEVWILPS